MVGKTLIWLLRKISMKVRKIAEGKKMGVRLKGKGTQGGLSKGKINFAKEAFLVKFWKLCDVFFLQSFTET